MTWTDTAFLLWDAEDPLENQTGHFTTEKHGNGLLSTFHPWDISEEAYEERLAAGPGAMPSEHDVSLERFRDLGEKHAAECEAAIWAALTPQEWPTPFGAAMLEGVPARER